MLAYQWFQTLYIRNIIRYRIPHGIVTVKFFLDTFTRTDKFSPERSINIVQKLKGTKHGLSRTIFSNHV